MKKLSLKTKIGSMLIILGISGAFVPTASAYTVYLLKKNYYGIVCADGQIFSYSGSSGGVGIVAPALCEGHGGVAGGSGGDLTAVKATAQVTTALRSCKKGKKINASTIQCPTRIRVNRIEMDQYGKKSPSGL